MTDGGPAFPATYPRPMNSAQDGMTLRDYFAAQALQMIMLPEIYRVDRWAEKGKYDDDVEVEWDKGDAKQWASSAYVVADAMLAQREKS